MNRNIFMGRLTADPDVRYFNGKNGETAVANFRIAVDRKFSKEKKADFFSCTAFDRMAEFVEDYLAKGVKILVEGRMENNNYTKDNGDQVYGMVLRVDNIEFAESKAANEMLRDAEPDDVVEDEPPKRSASRTNKSTGRSNQRPAARGRSASGSSGKTSSRRKNNDDQFDQMEESYMDDSYLAHDENYVFN